MNFSKTCEGDISYFDVLSKLNNRSFKIFDFGSQTDYRKGDMWLLSICYPSIGSRYKNNFLPTEIFRRNLPNSLVENLFTGKTLSANECYKMATCSESGNPYCFFVLGLLENIVARITILFNQTLVHQIHEREALNEYFFLC
ncbi:MAG: hypothetical protein KA716_27150 [Gloeotrichia echinulata DEX184]|nr:hypothetical protein [Gloeotrichia echinulata DEX184]